MLLVFVKHARPVVVEGAPPDEWELSDDGREAVTARLAPRLLDTGREIQMVVSSLEPKARDTGRALADGLGVTFQTGEGLHEHRRRTVGFLSDEVFEASVRGMFERPGEVVFGEEPAADAEARFSHAVDALRKAHRGTRLAVVAHGTVIALHLAARYGVDGFSMWRRLGLPSYVVVDDRLGSIVEVVDSV